MFIEAEIRLDLGFDAIQAKLANLVRAACSGAHPVRPTTNGTLAWPGSGRG